MSQFRSDTAWHEQNVQVNPGDELLSVNGNTLLFTAGYRNQSSTEATPTLLQIDRWVELTNSNCTGFHAPVASGIGQKIFVTNSTSADLVTGDFAIPNGSTYLIGWNGTSWIVLTSN